MGPGPTSGVFTPWPNRPWPPFVPKKCVFDIVKNRKTWFGPLCVSTSDQQAEIRLENGCNYPPPSNLRNFIDYPLPNRPENCSNYPPRIYGNRRRKTAPTTPLEFAEFTELHRLLPPSKSAGKTAPTTSPLEFTELHRLPPPPPSKSAGKTAPTTPLELTELHRLPPYEKFLATGWPPFLKS